MDSETYEIKSNYQMSDMDIYVLKEFSNVLKFTMSRDKSQILSGVFDCLRKLNRDKPGNFIWQNLELILRIGENMFNASH